MGNIFFCLEPNVESNLASIARDICPFPDYTPSPLLVNMLSINSSLHLRNHYRAVQSSLNPQQLEDFTKNLRTTFGREGKVTLGGVGVVALSLAVLFDTLAKQAKGEWVPDSGPIPGLFVKDLRGYYPPHVYTISEYLRLVPHIANNPTRMIEETERYIKQLQNDDQSMDKLQKDSVLPTDTTVENFFFVKLFADSLKLHLGHIKNTTTEKLEEPNLREIDFVIFNLNCDPEAADKDFLAQVQKSDNSTQETFEKCASDTDKPSLRQVAELQWIKAIYYLAGAIVESKNAQREDFDLKANGLGRWA